jgi:hypothetical protein
MFHLNDYDLAVHINIQSKKLLGRCNPDALSECEKEHLEAIVAVAMLQANCARSMAHRSVLSSVYDGTEPELDMALGKACEAGFIYLVEDEFHPQENVYRLNYDYADLPKRAYSEYQEWEHLF